MKIELLHSRRISLCYTQEQIIQITFIFLAYSVCFQRQKQCYLTPFIKLM